MRTKVIKIKYNMKNFTNNFKQFTSRLSARWLIMALMLLLGTSSAWGWDQIKGGMTFYLKPSSNWKESNAHFAIYLCNGDASNTWVEMTEVAGESGVYEATVPDTEGKHHKNIIFVRVNPDYKVPLDGNWTGKWNQTSDLEYTNGNNYYEGKANTWDRQGSDGWKSKKTLYYLMGLTDLVHGDNLSSSVSKNLAVDTHHFKVRDSQGNWYGNNGTMTRNNCSGWKMETEKNNCGITADVDGEYTFTFDASTKKLTVTYPELPTKADFFSWNIQYAPGDGTQIWMDNTAGKGDEVDLGELTNPYLKGINLNLWRDKNNGNVCGITSIKYKIDANTEQNLTFTSVTPATYDNPDNNNEQHFSYTWESSNGNNAFNIALPNTEGEHTVVFTFTASVDNNSNSSCDETTTMTGTITYEIPECSVPDGITIKYANGEKFCANSNVTLSPSVEHVDGYTYAWEVSGTGWSINSGSAARECEVKVGTGAGSVNLTVSNGTCSKEATTLDITPKASTPITTPTISATKQIICNGNDAFLSVATPTLTSGATYTLVYEGSEQADPAPIPYTGSESVKFAISKAGSYTVVAKTTDTGACQFTARAGNEIDFTSISFSQSEYITTPWVPVSVVVNAPEGTTYEYDDTAITKTTALKDAPIKTVSNNTYTYKLPRPTAWGEGNKTPANEDVDFTVSAKISVDTETCDIQSTVKLQDEGNDNCTTTNP